MIRMWDTWMNNTWLESVFSTKYSELQEETLSWTGRLDNSLIKEQKGCNEMDIYSSADIKGSWILLEMHLFVGIWINSDGKNRTGGEEGNRGGEERGRKGRGGELRFGGQTNKQTTHRFSAALRRSWGNPLASTIRLHSSPLMLKTLLAGGSPSSPSTAPPTSPSSSLFNSIPRTSPGDGASEVNHYQRLVIILLEEVRAGLPLRETDKRSGLRIQKLSACLHEDRTLNASSWML